MYDILEVTLKEENKTDTTTIQGVIVNESERLIQMLDLEGTMYLFSQGIVLNKETIRKPTKIETRRYENFSEIHRRLDLLSSQKKQIEKEMEELNGQLKTTVKIIGVNAELELQILDKTISV